MISALFTLLLAVPAEAPRLAVPALQCDPASICSGDNGLIRRSIDDKIEGAVLQSASDRLQVITASNVVQAMKAAGLSTSQICEAASCIVDLGNALQADYVLESKVRRIGTQYELVLKLWDMGKAVTISHESGDIQHLKSARVLAGQLSTQVLRTGLSIITEPVVKRKRRRKVESSELMGFDDEESTPSIESGQITKAVGGLMVGGSPSTALITLTTPSRKRLNLTVGDSREGLEPGTYTWNATADNYEPGSGTIEVRPDGFATIPVKLRKLAILKVTGTPARAKVVLMGPNRKRNEPFGIGSTLRGLAPETYTVQVSKGGFETQRKTVPLKPGSNEQVSFKLLPLGGLKVTGTPKGAHVSISGPNKLNKEGGLPWQAKGLKSGSYQVRVERQGYGLKVIDAVVKAGATTNIEIKLKRASRERSLRSNEPLQVLTQPNNYQATNNDRVRLSKAEQEQRKNVRLLSAVLFASGTASGAINYFGSGGHWSSDSALFSDVLMIFGAAGLLWSVWR